MLKINIKTYRNVLKIVLLEILCAMTSFSTIMALCMGVIQIIVLLYIIIVQRRIEQYIKTFLLFCSTCLDVEAFVYGNMERKLYYFGSLPVLRGYHMVLLLLLPCLMILGGSGFCTFKIKLAKYRNTRFSFTFLIFMFFMGILNIIPLLIVDDNEILSHIGIYIVFFRRNVLKYLTVILLFFILTYCFLMKESFEEEFRRFAWELLLGTGFSVLIIALLGWSANIGENGNMFLLLTQCSFFIVFLLVMPFYEGIRNGSLCFIVSLAAIAAMLSYPSGFSGKWWLTLGGVGVLWFIQSLRLWKGKLLLRIFGLCTISIGIVFIIKEVGSFIGRGYSGSKLEQAIRVLDISDSSWYEMLPNSPKFRIDELISVIVEYKEKPLFFLFGKGYAGTTNNHFGTLDWQMPSAFSEAERHIGYYINLHEALNCILLISGFLGIIFLVREILFFCKHMLSNYWCVVGIIWFLFFYSSNYVSLYWGLSCWVYAKIYVDMKTELRSL